MDKLLEDGFTILSSHDRAFSGTMADFRKRLETPFNFGMHHRPPAYATGGSCLLCRRGARKDSSFLESGVKTASKLALSMVPEGTSVLHLPQRVCPDCRRSVEEESTTVASTSRRFCCFERRSWSAGLHILVYIRVAKELLSHRVSSACKEPACNAGDPVGFLGQEGPLEKDRLPTPVFLVFPGGSDGKESACNAEDLGSIPGLGRSPRGGHGNPLQYSCLENPHGQWSLVGYSPGVTESQTQLTD